MIPIQRVAIIGASGWVGRALSARLASQGITVIGIGRRIPERAFPAVAHWQSMDQLDLSEVQSVVNLAGEPIHHRWTRENLQKFRTSRVDLTQQVVNHLRSLTTKQRPTALVSASAVGYYGDCADSILTEAHPVGRGFLADLCRDWEIAATAAEPLGLRVVTPRIGIVLGQGGSAFERLRRIFQLGLGGRLGTGRQWMPWIHLNDLTAALSLLATDRYWTGPVNLTAPHPLTNRDFTRIFAAACHRPALFPVPASLLKLTLGGFSSALLASQRATPHALTLKHFQFSFPDLPSALDDLLNVQGIQAGG